MAAALLLCAWSIRRCRGVTAVVGLAQKSPSSGTQLSTSWDTSVLRDTKYMLQGTEFFMGNSRFEEDDQLQGHNYKTLWNKISFSRVRVFLGNTKS